MRIEELLRRFGVEHTEEGAHHKGWIQFTCPFCKNPERMGYNIYGGYTNCWTCGSKPLMMTLCRLTGESTAVMHEYIQQLDRRVGRKVHKFSEEKRGELKLPPNLKPLTTRHKKYLKSRGLSLDYLERIWKIDKGIGTSHRLPWRIFIPIMLDNEMVSWTTRSLNPTATVRYMSAEPHEEVIFHKNLIYGEDYIRHAICLVEGPIDVWKIGPGAGCTFGTGYSRQQIKRICRFPVRAVCFDNEPAAQKAARKLCRQLAVFPGITTNIVLESAKDAGAADPDEVKQLRKLVFGDKLWRGTTT